MKRKRTVDLAAASPHHAITAARLLQPPQKMKHGDGGQLVYALSDLHLHSEEQPFLFGSEKEALFSRVVSEVLEEGASLLIAGDWIDFTGMHSPIHGHREFFEEIFPAAELRNPIVESALKRRRILEELRAVRTRFPHFFEALQGLASHRRLIIIPGNHDCQFQISSLRHAFAEELNVDPLAIQWRNGLHVGRTALVFHGNEFDPANTTAEGCDNPGRAITEALYRALMPALLVYGVPSQIVAAIPAVRPEEAVIRGISEHLGPNEAHRLIKAFVRLIARNGYFRGWRAKLLAPLTRDVPIISDVFESYLTPKHFISALSKGEKTRAHAREKAEQLHAALQPKIRAVVLGHTHELDHSEHYMNLGTWIDHITGVSLEHLRKADTSLPVMKIDPDEQHLVLLNARDLPHVPRLRDCTVLYEI